MGPLLVLTADIGWPLQLLGKWFEARGVATRANTSWTIRLWDAPSPLSPKMYINVGFPGDRAMSVPLLIHVSLDNTQVNK
jgi:hypothetical protein